jgi:hypothetical protein
MLRGKIVIGAGSYILFISNFQVSMVVIDMGGFVEGLVINSASVPARSSQGAVI